MKKIVLILFATAFYASCIKQVAPKQDFCADGHIFWGGDPSTSSTGIGYYFAVNRGINFKPYQVKETALAPEFKSQTDSIAVKICLKSTEEQAPSPFGTPMYYYEIKSISKR
jgi:hypothetical protein